MKDKALKLALEALELHGKQYPHMVKGYCLDAIIAIKEALAQPEQEPARWMMPDGQIVDKWALQFYGGQAGKPLYTTPPQRTWVYLTDEHIKEIVGPYALPIIGYTRKLFDQIEAKSKELNT